MKYQKGTFVVVPNKEQLKGKPSEMQAIYFWLCDHADDEGVCFPTKKRIAEEAGCSHNTVDKYLKQLVVDGFLSISNRKKKGSKENTSNSYQINIVEEYPLLVEPATRIGMTPPPNIGSETIPNTNSTQLTEVKEPTVLTTGKLPETRGKTYILRVLSIYRDLYRNKYGCEPEVNIGRFGKALKNLLTTKTELQVSAMLVAFFNWRGMDGASDFEQNKLTAAAHNFSWFFSTVNVYEVYLRNVFGLALDDELKVREFVATSMNSLK